MKLLRVLFKHETAGTMVALMFATMVCVGLVCGRIVWTGKMRYAFLVWNLMLAWMPLLLAVVSCEYFKTGGMRNWRFAGAAGAWLLFLPNAPYICTDLIHLTNRYLAHFWVDMTLILLCAFTGAVLGFVSLFLMQSVVSQKYGRVASWIFVAGVAGLSSVGVYLGRFLRFNSWDVLLRPDRVYRGIDAWLDTRVPGMSSSAFLILFATFLFISYVLLHALTQLPRVGRASIRRTDGALQ